MLGWSLRASLLSEPAVVEADADALGIDAVRHDFVPQPALEQHEAACGGRKRAPRAALALCRRYARRRRHESIEPRILELDSGSSRGNLYVVGAAHRRQGMQMQAMYHVLGHDVDPAIGHLQCASRQVPLDGLGEVLDMPRELFLQGLEGR